jgi:hypothetical protein
VPRVTRPSTGFFPHRYFFRCLFIVADNNSGSALPGRNSSAGACVISDSDSVDLAAVLQVFRLKFSASRDLVDERPFSHLALDKKGLSYHCSVTFLSFLRFDSPFIHAKQFLLSFFVLPSSSSYSPRFF